MPDAVIVAENLGKRYTLTHEVRHNTLRDTLAYGARGLARRLTGRQTARTHETFWALEDVSFTINRGEVVGIIGRNGAGKSTLLKILSRITEPTTGRAILRGRVASLLEVGTGFHPELTGRENIFLNGAILGMSRAEIRSRFDEIVAFAEVDRFLDTPVKHYSSGMYVRLAFAVAAHLEPEILIVDEVLAVGDSRFQRKCLGKMGEVANTSGRTVLFVSHNASALQSICRSGLWLQNGRLERSGSIADCLAAYFRGSTEAAVFNRGDRPHITSVRIDPGLLDAGALKVMVGFRSATPIAPMVGVILYNKYGQPITGANGRMAGERWQPQPSTEGIVTARLSQLPLHSDTYRISVWLGDASMDYDERRDVAEFEFVSRNFHPQAPPTDIIGAIDLPWEWSLDSQS